MKSLAIKYRPTTFDDVTEQGATVQILKNQLDTKTFKHCYLFCGGPGTGKTTLGRIFANALNHGQGNIIELDAASNNSVDDVREIIEQAQTKPLESEFKCFLVDECVTGETEILTKEGWKRIDSILPTDSIAQYTEDGFIEFVEDWEYVKHYYEGFMYDVALRNGKRHVLMSPHHVQPTRKIKSKKIVEEYIEDCTFGQKREVLVAGKGSGNNEPLSSLERLYIACQADGYCSKRSKKAFWEIHLSIPSKIVRVQEFLDDCGIPYKVYGDKKVSIRFFYEFPRDKKLSSFFEIDMGVERARDFINEILLWDGSTKSGYPGYYSCTDKDNVDFVSAILTLAGYSGTVNVTKYDNPNHRDVWNVNWYYQDYRIGQAVSKQRVEEFSGNIYCVKVPSKMIVLRAEGFAFISGNCHSLSNAAWQAFLKLIEEPPAHAIFIFCTTDPQRIPKTIISRVQRYQFQRISESGIIDRLKYIMEAEEIRNYESAAIEYIAKISEGGMRDAITMVDQCLSYSESLTIENVCKALGLTEHDTLINFTEILLEHKSDDAIKLVEDVHTSGIDLKQFIRQYVEFLVEVSKYYVTGDLSYTKLPDTDDIKKFLAIYDVKSECILDLLDMFLEIDRDIKYSPNAKTYIEARIMVGDNNDRTE